MTLAKNYPTGLFLNPYKANCSIYESGLMIYKSLLLSEKYKIDYQEINKEHSDIPLGYDFYAFNYHYSTMGWLDTRCIRNLSGLKLTFILETLPNDPFVLCPSKDFDAYCPLDPTISIPDKRVYTFPRPLEIPENLPQYAECEIPVIGTFGFATPGKGFELVVEAVNKEFDKAIVKINIPYGTYTDDAFWELHKQNYANYLFDLCRKTARQGIEIVATRDFMTKQELIKWCSQNTLNCFLYDRNSPGLSATTDQAISSGRPIAVSANQTFRHIHSYIEPYPLQSLSKSIETSSPRVRQMQNDWSPKNFASKFEQLLDDYKLPIVNECKKKTDNYRLKIKKKSIIRKCLSATALLFKSITCNIKMKK